MRKGAVFITVLLIMTLQISACAPAFTPQPDNSTGSESQSSETPITGAAQISLDAARAWARARDADENFVDLAACYWQYGERFGIRPEVMYAQAALETDCGRFGGRVTPDMNNFAGIKKYGADGDATDDHESFASPEAGVLAHYNHMSAYVGIAPIGDVHGRYYSVARLSWAGEIRTAEELGGKWCPDPDYGHKLVDKYLNEMYEYQKG